MGFSLRNFLEEVAAQINPFDGGKTAASVRAARQETTRLPVPGELEQKIKNAKYGVLANNQHLQDNFIRSVTPSRLNALSATVDSALQAPKIIGKPFWETADTVRRLPGGFTGKDPDFTTSLDQSIIGGLGRFGQSITSAAFSPYTNYLADREKQRAEQLLTPSYENLYRSYGEDPRMGANQAQIEANKADYSLRTDPLNRSKIGVNDSLGTTARKIAAQGGEAALDLLNLPVMGKAVTTGLVKSPGRQFVKNTISSGTLAAGGSTLYTAQQEGITPADYVKGATVGFALGTSLPVTTKLVAGGVRNAIPAAKTTAQLAKEATPDAVAKRSLLKDSLEYRAITEAANAKVEKINQYNRAGQKPPAYLVRGYENDLNTLAKMRRATSQGGYARVPGGKLDPAPDLTPEQKSFFYRQVFKEKGKSPTKQEWFDYAKKQLESSKTAYGASAEYNNLPKKYNLKEYAKSDTAKDGALDDSTFSSRTDPSFVSDFTRIGDLLSPGARELKNRPSARMSKAELESLYASVPPGTQRKLKIAKLNTEKNVPVFKLTREGDTVTSTNLNPNIKRGEKRYSLDDTGNLIEDRKSAYRIFTDEDGRIQNIRIGKQVFSSKDFGDLSEVNDYGSTLATMRRNIERGFGKKTSDKLSRFLVDHQQEQANKMIERRLALKQDMKAIADDLGIKLSSKRGKKISAAIQDFGEKNKTKAQLVEEFGKDIANKIVQADRWFRNQYDKLLSEMNEVLDQYGYDPIPKRKNYYTHFQDDRLWRSFGLKMQEIRDQFGQPTLQDATPTRSRGKISNKLAGESEFTQPNKRFNPFALQRKGDTYTPDAFQAFERYLIPTLNNIYMTPSISRARVIAKAVAQEADLVGKDANKIIIQIKEWANDLAGKSNRFDRPLIDSKGGQYYLKAANWAQRKAGQNTIVGNLSTAIMQPIVLVQTVGKFGFKNTILAAMQEMGSAHAKDAPIRQSKFMRRRYADTTPLTASKIDKARNIANTPLNIVEETAARITWNAAHNYALSQGIKGKAAIRYADTQADKTLAGRSIGERPELFRSKAAGPLTMYQLEVNNFWQQFGKEMTKTQAAKTMVAAYCLNLLLQEATGRQVGFNPIDAAIDSYQEIRKEKKPGFDKAKAVGQRFAGEFVDNTPFVGPLANAAIGDRRLRDVLGPSSNTGRFGVSSPLSALFNTTNIAGLPVPQNVLLPFGGAQANKTYEGLRGYLEGQLKDKDGEALVNIPQRPENLIKGVAFGKSAIPEVSIYYDNLGRKKEDQKFVPNQTISKAASQSLWGLTKDQQEQYAALPDHQKEAFLELARQKNAKTRASDKVKEKFKSSDKTEAIELPDGKFYGKIGDKYVTKDSKEEFDIAKAKHEFKQSNEKAKIIGDTYYYKTKSGSIQSKSKVQYEYDKTAKSRAIKLDSAYEKNQLNEYVKLVEEELNELEKLKTQYDPETEQDKIDAITLKQQNLVQRAQSYLEKSYTKRPGVKKTNKPKSRYSSYRLYAFGPQPTTLYKSLREIVKQAQVRGSKK